MCFRLLLIITVIHHRNSMCFYIHNLTPPYSGIYCTYCFGYRSRFYQTIRLWYVIRTDTPHSLHWFAILLVIDLPIQSVLIPVIQNPLVVDLAMKSPRLVPTFHWQGSSRRFTIVALVARAMHLLSSFRTELRVKVFDQVMLSEVCR